MPLATDVRLDDMTVNAFVKELEYKESKVIQTLYPEYKAASGKIIPIEELNLPWVESTSFRMQDAVGSEFELADDQTTNLTFVDLLSQEFRQGVYSFRKGYFFTEREVARSVHLGAPIEEQKIAVVRRLYLQTLNRLVLFGHKRTRQAGFVNHPAWLRIAAPFPLDSSSTVSQKLVTLNAGGKAIIEASERTIMPDTLLLPDDRYDYLLSQDRLDTTMEKTTLRFFLENNPCIKNIDYLPELKTAGPNGERVAIFYKRSPEVCIARITDPFRFREPIREPFRLIRPVAFDWNGIIPYMPFSVCVMLGV